MNSKERGNQAKMLLDHPVMKEAFETLEKYYTDKMVLTALSAVEERNEWHSCVFALNDVKTTLTSFVEHGKIEASNEAKRERNKHDGNSTSSRDK